MPSEVYISLSSLNKTPEEIGASPLDPTSTTHCWSCFVSFETSTHNYYTQHEHPTLGILVCSICHDNAEYVERKTLDSHDDSSNSNNGISNEDSSEAYCSLSLSELDTAHPPLADGESNDLFLCDSCPRAFCVKCICVTRGGSKDDLTWIRCAAESQGEWNCCLCCPTDFLGRLKEGYAALVEEDNSLGEEEDKDEHITKLIDELYEAESKYSNAQNCLENEQMDQKRKEIEDELRKEHFDMDECTLIELVEEELESYRSLWINHSERIQETIGKLLNDLEDEGINVADIYRSWEKGDEEEEEITPGWKREADLALDARDISEGFGKGEFRGATGYKAKDTRIYKIEPEDLNLIGLNEIEDINSTQGAINQMSRLIRHEEKLNQWGSKTGTTTEDIEMFQKKCAKFEEVALGDKIDLKKLENNYIRDQDDEILVKKECAAMTVRRKNGNGARIVRRTATVKKTKKEVLSNKLSSYSYYHKPSMTSLPKTNAAPPKPKKRAQLLQSSFTLTDHVFPDIKGLLIGDDVPFQDSNIILPVKNCTSKISICKPLASVLKEHQIEGIKFCWDRICTNLFDSGSEGANTIRGAILAHAMGVGKSIQTVTILHTLLTHPSLIRSSISTYSTSTNRLVHRVLLISPVNTLANWNTEFNKWVGEMSLPFIRFLPFKQPLDRRQRVKLIQEWYTYGGVLCCSNAMLASTIKIACEPNNTNKKDYISDEDYAMLSKAVVNPGPDIVVLDEAHTMLKNNTTSVFKALNKIQTKLRLSLTGTPLQNNLLEYYRMANWTRPGCLGSETRFINKFDKPIIAAMSVDCTETEVARQDELSSELREILSSIVHRCTNDVLKKTLPFLQETIITIRQSRAQAKLYREFNKYKRANKITFWHQYHALRPVGNHPACLPFFRIKMSGSDSSTEMHIETDVRKAKVPESHAWFCDKCKVACFDTFEETEEHEASCIEIPVDTTDDSANKEWWKAFHDKVMRSGLNITSIENGGKIVAFLQILAHCTLIGDKVVLFSKCLATLNYIEEILQHPSWAGFAPFLPDDNKDIGGWSKDNEYSRIDGAVDADTRGQLIKSFNTIKRLKLFLVSIEAGGLGVNLVGANRVILFDAHWNPAIIDQAVHRCYRYGQKKPVFCYQFLAEGTMEEKIYSRAKTKTSLSKLVLDEKNVDRLFTRRELDLLEENDTWVSCEACFKWRMLPPDMPDDEVANLPEKWFCKDNIYDPDRSFCDAPAQSSQWYAFHWEAQKHASQNLAPFVVPQSNDTTFEIFAKRDVVLQTLLERCESASTGGNAKSINSWISKYSFSNETIQDSSQIIAVSSADKEIHSEPPGGSQKKTNMPTSISENNAEIISNTTFQPVVPPLQGLIPRKQPYPSDNYQTEIQRTTRLPEICKRKVNLSNQSANSTKKRGKIDKKSQNYEELVQNRKSSGQISEMKKSPMPNSSIQPTSGPETIDLLDSDSD